MMLLIFPGLMMFAALSDLLTMKISNKVSLLLVAAFFCSALLLGFPLQTISAHAAVAFGVLSITFGFFAMGWMGGGDAKLMAATALWFGPTADLFSYLVTSALIGGSLTLSILAARARISPYTGVVFVDRLLEPRSGIPYGIALGIGGLLVFADSKWMDLAFAR